MFLYCQSFLFSLITLVYACQASLTQENFTGIANNLHHPIAFILWSFLAATYFYHHATKLFKSINWQPKYLHLASILVFIGISCSSLVPYQKTMINLEALHVFLSLGASVLFILLIEKCFWDIRYLLPSFYQKCHPLFQMIIFTLLVVWLTFGYVNSLLEVLMVSLLSFFLSYAQNLFKKI